MVAARRAYIYRVAGFVVASGVFVALLVLLFDAGEAPRYRHAVSALDEERTVVAGNADLTDRDLSRSISLDGEWIFYRDRLLDYDDLSGDAAPEPAGVLAAPGSWNGARVDGISLDRYGHGTYRVDMTFDDSQLPATIYFYTTEISSSARLTVDGEPVASTGVPGTSPRATSPSWGVLAGSVHVEREEVTLLLQVANYHHARGGMFDPLLVADRPIFERWIRFDREIAFFLTGALLIMGLYHLGLYTFGVSRQAALLFGSITMIMAVRTSIVAPAYIVRAGSVWQFELLMTVEYLTMILGVVLFAFYIGDLFPQERIRRIERLIAAIAAPFALFTLFGPARYFTGILPYFHLLTVAASVYVAVVVVCAVRSRRRGSLISMVGLIVLLTTIVNDILYNLGFLWTTYLADVGLFAFLFSQSMVLTGQFADNYRRTRNLLREKIRLTGLSFRDALTGISNRRSFDATIAREWERAQRSGMVLSLLMLDIDYFKQFNDSYGHQAGDRVLKEVARVVRDSLERPADFVARYGGEEFAVILPETNMSGALHVAERLRQAISECAIPRVHRGADGGGNALFVTASFGVAATVPDRTETPHDLIHRADQALYQAKALGRNRVES